MQLWGSGSAVSSPAGSGLGWREPAEINFGAFQFYNLTSHSDSDGNNFNNSENQ